MAANNKPSDKRLLSRADLDTLYSPSCWSKKLAPHVIVDNHFRVITEATQKVKGQVKHTLDIAYGSGGAGETIDVYYPDQECGDKQSVFIFIHGGYWSVLGKEHYGYVCLPLVQQGLTVAVVNFDNAPKGTMTTIVDQCRRACVHVLHMFPDKRLYICGHSAGAHLSACMLSTDWVSCGLDKVNFSGAILISGIYDLDPIQRCYVNDPLNLTETEVMEYSPQRLLTQLKANIHPDFCCLLAHGEQESPEFKRQGQEYNQGLLNEGVRSSVWEVEGEDHFTVAERLSEVQYSLTGKIIDLITQS